MPDEHTDAWMDRQTDMIVKIVMQIERKSSNTLSVRDTDEQEVTTKYSNLPIGGINSSSYIKFTEGVIFFGKPHKILGEYFNFEKF